MRKGKYKVRIKVKAFATNPDAWYYNQPSNLREFIVGEKIIGGEWDGHYPFNSCKMIDARDIEHIEEYKEENSKTITN